MIQKGENPKQLYHFLPPPYLRKMLNAGREENLFRSTCGGEKTKYNREPNLRERTRKQFFHMNF